MHSTCNVGSPESVTRLASRRKRGKPQRKREYSRERENALCAPLPREHTAHAPLHRAAVGGQRHAEGEELVGASNFAHRHTSISRVAVDQPAVDGAECQRVRHVRIAREISVLTQGYPVIRCTRVPIVKEIPNRFIGERSGA